jgi:hypothetical protein
VGLSSHGCGAVVLSPPQGPSFPPLPQPTTKRGRGTRRSGLPIKRMRQSKSFRPVETGKKRILKIRGSACIFYHGDGRRGW